MERFKDFFAWLLGKLPVRVKQRLDGLNHVVVLWFRRREGPLAMEPFLNRRSIPAVETKNPEKIPLGFCKCASGIFPGGVMLEKVKILEPSTETPQESPIAEHVLILKVGDVPCKVYCLKCTNKAKYDFFGCINEQGQITQAIGLSVQSSTTGR